MASVKNQTLSDNKIFSLFLLNRAINHSETSKSKLHDFFGFADFSIQLIVYCLHKIICHKLFYFNVLLHNFILKTTE